jgi:hypothetical protein
MLPSLLQPVLGVREVFPEGEAVAVEPGLAPESRLTVGQAVAALSLS